MARLEQYVCDFLLLTFQCGPLQIVMSEKVEIISHILWSGNHSF